jgi:hypothetical protein
MTDKFIFCLEAVDDVDVQGNENTMNSLAQLAWDTGIDSIYQTCDTIEGLEDSLNALIYADDNFKGYEIIYLVMPGEENNICINNYYYSLDEIAEIFEGKLKGKILHFANAKVLDLTPDESQYFLDITGAKAVSGYGELNNIASVSLDKAFFTLCQDEDDVTEVVEELYRKHYTLCKTLDFRLYY